MDIKSSMFIKFIVFYVIILFIPIMVIAFYFYPKNINLQKKYLMERNKNIVEHVQKSIDLQLGNIYKVPLEFANNSSLRNNFIEKSDFNNIKVKKEISKYISTNTFVYEAFIYLFKQESFYSRSAIISKEDFGLKFYNYENWDYYTMHSSLINCKKLIVKPSNNVRINNLDINNAEIRPIVSFIFPIPLGNNSPYGVVLIMVDEKTIYDSIKLLIKQFDGNIIISSNSGEIISSLKKTDYLYTDAFKSFLAKKPVERPEILTINSEKFIFTSVASKKIGWNYIGVIPENRALSDVKTLNKNNLTILYILVLFELIIVIFAMKTNYNPIKKLFNIIINSSKHMIRDENKMNEIEAINFTFNHLTEINLKYIDNVYAIKESLLLNLISGKFKTIKEYNDKAKDMGILFNYSYFIISKIIFENSNYSTISNICYEDIFKNNKHKMDIYFIPDIEINGMIGIMSASTPNLEIIKKVLISFQEHLNTIFDLKTLIAVGIFVNDMKKLKNSYNFASYTYDFMKTKRLSQLACYNDLPGSTSLNNKYPYEVIYNINYAIIQKDKQKVKELSSKINDILLNIDTPLYLIRTIYIDLMQIILKHLNYYDPTIIKNISEINPLTSTKALSNIKLCEIIETHIKKLCSFLEEEREDRNSAVLLNNILRFINKHYLDLNFSIELVAEQFNMSISSLSHFFKYHSGNKFSQYTNDIKIKHGKYLLINTDLSIEQIALKLRYSNSSSFGRVFKKIVQKTPGEFRTDNKKLS